MNANWTIHHLADVPRFVVQFPANNPPADMPKGYAVVRAAGVTEYLAVADPRPHATGQVVIVSPKSKLPLNAAARWQPTPAWRYQLFRLRHDTRRRLTLLGVVLGLLGLLIDGGLSIGVVMPVLVVPIQMIAGFMWLSLALKVIGLLLVFLNDTILADK